MNKTKRRRHIIAVLVMFSFLLTSTTFAYWASAVEGTAENATSQLAIGSGKAVSTAVSFSPNIVTPSGFLVPRGHLHNSIGFVTEEVKFNYQLHWHEEQLVTQVTGEEIIGAINTNITFDIFMENSITPLDKTELAHIYNLIHVDEYETNPTLILLNNEKASDFGYIVSMSEPANKTDYEIISNATINMYFEFVVETDVYDLDLDFTKMTMDDVLAYQAVSRDMSVWKTELGEGLNQTAGGQEKLILFPITKDEYTITVNAKLSNPDSLSGGYGILFDTVVEDGTIRDSGLIFQFDRGYSYGEMIVRERILGRETHPIFRVTANDGYFDDKYVNPEWWTSIQEITIEVRNYSDTERIATYYINGVEIGDMIYDYVYDGTTQYVGFRTWSNSPTEFYDLKVK